MDERLNYKLWRTHLDSAMATKDAKTVTWLHAVRAHIKGKIHCRSMRLPWSNLWHWGKLSYEDASAVAANGGSLVVETNSQDQKFYIGDAWQQYLLTPEQVEARKNAPKVKTRKGLMSYIRSLFSEV